MSVPNKHGGGVKNLQEKQVWRHAYLEHKSILGNADADYYIWKRKIIICSLFDTITVTG